MRIIDVRNANDASIISARYRRTQSPRNRMNHLFLFFFVCISTVSAQNPPRNVQINPSGSAPEEVTIAINPVNPDNLVAGANIRYAYWSTDGGIHWSQNLLPQGTYGDPCVIFDADGRAFFSHLTTGWAAITLRRSEDGGKTWSTGVALKGPSSDSAKPGSLYRSSLQDKEWMIADQSTGPHRGNIYAAWTDFTKYGSHAPTDSSVIVFARSTDHGVTFEQFVRVSDTAGDAVDSDNTMEGAVPAVGPNSEVYLGWAGPHGIYFDRSFDGGRTWGKDMIISDLPGGWDFEISGINRSNGMPVTVADISGSSHRGTVYINWVDFRNGDADVFIMKSTDRGTSWSQPIRVNNDPLGNGRAQFFTWATVDQVTGELDIVFYDRRSYDSDSTDVYLARSMDGGTTFSNERISDSVFVPTADDFFGDYICIAAHNGRIRPIWTRLHNGELSIHTALIDPPISQEQAPAQPEEGILFDAFPNPLTRENAHTATIRFQIPTAGTVRLTLHDHLGRTVRHLADGWYHAGESTVPVRGDSLVPGSYFFRMEFGTRASGGKRTIQSHSFTLL